MPLRFRCPYCQTPLSIASRKAYTAIQCPRCKGTTTVPGNSDAALMAAPPAFAVASLPEVSLFPETPLGRRPVTAAQPLAGSWVPFALAAAFLCVAGLIAYLASPEGSLLKPRTEDTPVAVAEKQHPILTQPKTASEPAPVRKPEQPPTPAERPREEPVPVRLTPAEPKPAPDPRKETPPRAPRPRKENPPPPKPPATPPPPAPEEPKPSEPLAHAALTVKRRQRVGAEELRKQLLTVPEVALDAVPETAKSLLGVATALRNRGLAYPGPVLLRPQRPDLAGLPLHMGQDCHLGKEPAEALQVLSRKLRVHLEAAVKAGDGVRPDPDKLRALLLGDRRHEWLKTEAIPALMQLLQAENTPVRKLLVELLGRIKGKEASAALAVRAMTDLAAEVRADATLELRKRPHDEFTPLLQDGLLYPWAAVADHAAETIATLDLKETIPAVVKMLGEPDASLPFHIRKGRGTIPVLRELVRVNHLGNCVLCHAPSADRTDLVRGAVPTPGLALPAAATTPAYYERGGSFVRADVTYLRQDFSVVQTVDNHGVWPAHQRFDYLVRLRPLTTRQVDFLTRQAKQKKTSAQKEAMLFVLRELTGKDLGTRPEDWFSVLPADRRQQPSEVPAVTGKEDWKQFLPGARESAPASATAEARRLRQQLITAQAEDQGALIEKLKSGPAASHIQALAESIPQLTGTVQAKARSALAGRLTALSGTELADRLQDDQAEIRRAAAAACARKDDKSHIPGLIALLDDREAAVVQAARQALTRLSGQDFGPNPEDGAETRARAVKAWSTWWKKQLGP